MFRRSFVSLKPIFRRVRIAEHGGPEVMKIEEFQPNILAPKPGQVVVRNSFAGVNFIDTYFRSGMNKKPVMPYTPGEEGAGAIVQVGDDSLKHLLGQRVAYYGGEGSYSSFTVVPTGALVEIPEGLADKEAAAVACQGFTAHYLTHDSFVCAPGTVVLLHGAAGGTGLLLSQMAKLRGATVIGVCGGAEKAALAQSVGRCDHVIDYTSEPDWPAAVRRLFPDGVHAVYDGVGKSTFQGSLSVLRRHGYMISFGNASGAVPPVAPLELTGSIFLQRPKLGDYMVTEEERKKRQDDVFGWMKEKQLTVEIGKIFTLETAKEAHDLLEGKGSTGKLLIDCRGE
ncbi:Alcohol dehydrogenase GroES-like domain/Zinc-binding dehydrogenase, putative [Angomonas deanei]|uniref:Alcohol dehydrogenase GroES-like domain/Zinc-binding dehydrogenase, putative n=1 Tax=Angomonas deanei TaxID=59799 RepID=A0A7G2CT34_9TRYP|nr:Alcohol dehydrogenase GroES-like domain/Zinc-binding dehydrogenase, putative [Angomonas deanei]